MGEGPAEVEAPAFMPGRTSRTLLYVRVAMDTSRDTTFRLRLGAPEDMLVTFDGLKRPVGAALHAICAARHAASTQYWADVVNHTCHTIDDLRAVMARRVPPPTADYYFGAADREITMGENERALREAR